MKPFYTHSQRNTVIVAIILLLGVYVLYLSRIIFDGMLGAVIFFAIFHPLQVFLTRRLKWHGGLAAITIIVLSFLILILPFITLIWMVYDKISYYQQNMGELGLIKEKLWPLIQKYVSNPKNMEALIKTVQSKFFAIFTDAVNSFSNILLQLTVMYFALYFMLKEHIALEKALVKYLPFKGYNLRKFGSELTNITYSNLLGQGFICFVQGLLVAIGFLIFGLDDPLFWGIICFFLSFIPFVGSPMVFVPAGLFELYMGNTISGVGILIWGFVLVINIDNVIRFYLAKKIGDTHPMITILGVIIGIPAFGILGLVYGPLLLSYMVLLVKVYEEESPASTREKPKNRSVTKMKRY